MSTSTRSRTRSAAAVAASSLPPPTTTTTGAARPSEKENTRTQQRAKPKSNAATGQRKAKKPVEVYCLCRKPDDGSPMVNCAQCNDWYHFTCIQLSPEEAEDISVYICPQCTDKTGRRTTMTWEGQEALEPQQHQQQLHHDTALQAQSPTLDKSHSEPPHSDIEEGSEYEHVLEKIDDVLTESDDPDSDDDYVAEQSKKNKKRSARRLSLLSEHASVDDDLEPRNRRISRGAKQPSSSQSPAPATVSHKRKSSHHHNQGSAGTTSGPPAQKRKKPSGEEQESDPTSDPTRKYCLTKLEEVFGLIFDKYLVLDDDDDDDSVHVHDVVEGTALDEPPDEVRKRRVKERAGEFSSALERCIYTTYVEMDRMGRLSAGGKYKERFRMLQFNLSKPDRVTLHRRIASGLISPAELAVMSSTELANEEMKESIKNAEKESLEHSILQKTMVPRAKITHKGLQDIEDDTGNRVVDAREKELEEEMWRERERIARLKAASTSHGVALSAAAAAAANRNVGEGSSSSSSVPPESPIAPHSATTAATWPAGGLPLHLLQTDHHHQHQHHHQHTMPSLSSATALRPTLPLFSSPSDSSSSLLREPELNLTDIIHIDDELGQEEGDGDAGPASSVIPDSCAALQPPAVGSGAPLPPLSVSTTGPSPFTVQEPGSAIRPLPPPIHTSSSSSSSRRSFSFDLNSLWSAAPKGGDEGDAVAATSAPADPSSSSSEHKEEELVNVNIDVTSPGADDRDFDMFLEEKDTSTPMDITPPPSPQESFDTKPQVWDGMITMPLDSSIPQNTPVIARQMGGRPLSFDSPLWKILFPAEELRIDGRVPVDKSAHFLLQMRMNPTKELIAVAFSPKPDSDNAGDAFKILSDFLINKGRHGLVFPWGSRPKDHHPGKELYMIPLRAEDPLPEYIELLDDMTLPKTRSSHYIIGIYILGRGKLVAPSPGPSAVPGLATTSTPVPPPPPAVPVIQPDVLAAEVASLSQEQIQAMLRALSGPNSLLQNLGLAPPLRQPPALGTTTIPSQGSSSPPQPPPLPHFPPPRATPSAQAPWPYTQPPGSFPSPPQPPLPAPLSPYERRPRVDSGPPGYPRGDISPRGPSYDSPRGRGGPGGRGGRGRNGGGGGKGGDFSPAPVDSGWPRKNRRGGGSPGQGRW